MADQSGTRLEVVLKDIMTQIQGHITLKEDEEGEEKGNDDFKMDMSAKAPPVSESQWSLPPPRSPRPPPSLFMNGQQGARTKRIPQPGPSKTETAPRVTLSENDYNPPGIQKLVVEHVLRDIDPTGTAYKLRPFSGRLQRPSNEVDFETWRSQIDMLLVDPNLSPLQVTRRIFESVLTPAADLLKPHGPDTLPAVLLRDLDSFYGTVQDGEDLHFQFLKAVQNPGERPSSYLQRLHVMLSTVVKRGGVQADDADRYLFKQFVKTCWDNTGINMWQLEQRTGNPPNFSELSLWLRTEENRYQAKQSLMKQHLSSSSKPKAAIQSQSTCSCGHASDTNAELKELRKQVQDIQRQMSAFLSAQKKPASDQPASRQASRSSPQSAAVAAAKPKPWYCFNCGEDGHISSTCKTKANPRLVEQKKQQLRMRQKEWNIKNEHLN